VLLAVASRLYVRQPERGAHPWSSTPVSSFTFVGEFVLALWLVIFGRRVI